MQVVAVQGGALGGHAHEEQWLRSLHSYTTRQAASFCKAQCIRLIYLKQNPNPMHKQCRTLIETVQVCPDFSSPKVIRKQCSTFAEKTNGTGIPVVLTYEALNMLPKSIE